MIIQSAVRKEARKHLKPASLYAAFGLSALVAELSLFFLLAEKAHAPLLTANAIAVGTGMFISFSLNVAFNFKVVDRLLQRFGRYSGVVGIGYVCSSALLTLLVSLGLSSFLAKLISLPFVFLLQYGLNQRLTFSQHTG